MKKLEMTDDQFETLSACLDLALIEWIDKRTTLYHSVRDLCLLVRKSKRETQMKQHHNIEDGGN